MRTRAQRGGRSTAGARAARRRGQRGAAMAEALVAIPFFILMFAGMIFIGDLYRTKLATHRKSTNDAWTLSLKGCDEKELGPLPVTKDVDLGEAAGTPQAQLCEEGFGMVRPVAEGTVKKPSMIPGGSVNATTMANLICDEDPETGKFDGAAEFLWQQFAPPEMQPGGTP